MADVRDFSDYSAEDRDVINRFNSLHDLVYLHPSLEVVQVGGIHREALRVKEGERILVLWQLCNLQKRQREMV